MWSDMSLVVIPLAYIDSIFSSISPVSVASYKAMCKETTQSWYEGLYKRRIQPYIGAMRLSAVREANVQSVLTKMILDGYSAKYVKGVRTMLFSLFDKAQANNLIVRNPAQRLKGGGKEQKERRELTPDERTAYLAACKTHPFGQFAAILYFFGLRRGEALALKKSDFTVGIDGAAVSLSITKQHIFPDNNMPQIGTPKTAAGTRTLPIPDKAPEYINFEGLPQGLLFSAVKVDDNGNE